LQQLAQRDFHASPVYRILSEEGPHHARVFRTEVAIGELHRAEGEGNSKQSAQVAAARALLAALMAQPAPERNPSDGSV
jgi:ribonuclease-3